MKETDRIKELKAFLNIRPLTEEKKEAMAARIRERIKKNGEGK